MKKINIQYLLILIAVLSNLGLYAQEVYVDSYTGDDTNPGTIENPVFSISKAMEIINNPGNDIYVMKINPGIYILDNHIEVATEKTMTNKRIVIEATVLPDDSTWIPDKMPVIKSISGRGEIMISDLFLKDYWITSFYINENHVTIRGLKFLGHHYPKNIFYPISRFDTTRTDLLVEQCMFLGNLQSSVIQVGVIARGNSVKVNHCVFYNSNNAIILYGKKPGSSITNCIVYGATESALWTVWQNADIIFKNNIISNCNFFWTKNDPADTTIYSIDNCVIVNNQHYQGLGYLKPATFRFNETNVIKEGQISLRMINSIWEPYPKNHLHIIPESLGYDIGAGLFKNK
jgi:hypothetical protein